MRFGVLGPLRVHGGQTEVPVRADPQRRLLAVLLSREGGPVTLAGLVDALWPDAPPGNAVKNIQSYLSKLKTTLQEPDRIRLGPAGYAIKLSSGELDAWEFTHLAKQAGGAKAEGELDRAALSLEQALALWRGRPYAGLEDCTPLGPEIQRLEQAHRAAVEDHAEIALALNRHADVVPGLSAFLAQHPDRETVARLLMLALHRSGRRTDALQVYRQIRGTLVEVHGVEPGTELREIHQGILRGEDGSSGPPASRTQRRTTPRSGPKPTIRSRIVPAQLPADIASFAGRGAELAHLGTLFDHDEEQPPAVVISALTGTAGVGKTALAVHFAHRIAERFPDGQLYVNLRGFDPSGAVMEPAEAIRGFLDALDVPPARTPVALEAQAALYRSLLNGKRVLVVLDNARDSDQIRPLLPGSPGCLVIVTSRNALTGLVTREGGRPLSLDLLTDEEARQLLGRRLGADRISAEPAAVRRIVDACARLPLALAIVAARAAVYPQFPLRTLAGELRTAQHSLDAFTGADDAGTDVRTVFSWSYQQLTPEAQRLFRLLGLHPGPDTSAPAAASLAGLSPTGVRPLLTELTHAHLVALHAPGRYVFHDLLRVYAAELARHTDSEDRRHAAIHRLLDHYLHTAYAAERLLNPPRDPLTLPQVQDGVTPEPLEDFDQAVVWFSAEHAVLLGCLAQARATGFDVHAWQLAWALDSFLYLRGPWHDRAAAWTRALEATLELGDRSAQALARQFLARADIELGRLDDAHVHLRHALTLVSALGVPTGQAHTHLVIGRVYAREGRYADALGHARQALALYRSAGHRLGQAHVLNSIGWYQAHLGRYQQAVDSCEEALGMNQELGARDAEAATWDSLGYAHYHLGDHHNAIACYRQAAALYQELGNRYQEATTLAGLGDAVLATGDAAAARQAWKQALAILDDINHPDADDVRAKLDQLRDHQGLRPGAP